MDQKRDGTYPCIHCSLPSCPGQRRTPRTSCRGFAETTLDMHPTTVLTRVHCQASLPSQWYELSTSIVKQFGYIIACAERLEYNFQIRGMWSPRLSKRQITRKADKSYFGVVEPIAYQFVVHGVACRRSGLALA